NSSRPKAGVHPSVFRAWGILHPLDKIPSQKSTTAESLLSLHLGKEIRRSDRDTLILSMRR
ncbi:MAG: hypothetical protein ACKVGW_22230, partial [Verrucomicrobiia bacterium]